jgi:carbon monoxide dehydrogenase subunit G
MELSNEFTVAAPVDRAWAVLTDVETIAPCLPGAKLEEIAGDEYRGIVKVKVGPITAQYKGVATFVEQDEAARKVVLKGDGRDTRGQGTASALITAQLAPDGDSATKVSVTTDLTITGKVAQFGRGVMADVSAKLMDQFADNLAAVVDRPAPVDAETAGGGAMEPEAVIAEAILSEDTSVLGEPAPTPETPAAAAPKDGPPATRVVDLPDPEPIDLLGTAGAPVAKRLIPVIGALALLVLVIRLLRRRT